MTVRTAAERPPILAIRLVDRQSVDARDPRDCATRCPGCTRSRPLPGHECSRRTRQAGLSGSRRRGRKAEGAAADLVTSSWEYRSCDGGGGAGAPPACGFRKDAKPDRKTSALLARGFPLPAVADPPRSGRRRPPAAIAFHLDRLMGLPCQSDHPDFTQTSPRKLLPTSAKEAQRH
jgi:hypothetical protein